MTPNEVVIASSSKVTQAGGWGAVVAILSQQETIALVGIAVGVIGLLVNWYYRRKDTKINQYYKAREDAREQVEHEKRMRDYEN
jgi:hypothetical protein